MYLYKKKTVYFLNYLLIKILQCNRIVSCTMIFGSKNHIYKNLDAIERYWTLCCVIPINLR